MPCQRPPRSLPVLASALAAAGIMLAVVGCGNITPLGPAPAPVSLPPARHLGSPITMQIMRSQPPTPTGRCAAGWVGVFLPPGAPAMPCFFPVGTPVTITSAAVSPVLTFRPPPGQPKGPSSYGLMVAVPAADVAAVTAVIRHAYDSRGAVGISVAGKLWQAAKVLSPVPGQRLEISLFSRTEALQLHRMLVPSG